jgi:hypothetical protein
VPATGHELFKQKAILSRPLMNTLVVAFWSRAVFFSAASALRLFDPAI